MTTLANEIQSLSPTAIIELFELELRNGEVFHFHAGTNRVSGPIIWRGKTYVPTPIEAEGFDVTAEGKLPRPVLRVANAQGVFSAEARMNDDLVMCKLTRKRTHVRFLDAENFPGGVNPTASNEHYPDQVWFIHQKTAEDNYFIEWELASPFDLEGVRLPFRQVIQNTCCWKYRGPECGYTGTAYFDSNDNPVWDRAKDVCGKRLSSCKKRQGQNSILTFGGFPGARRYE